MYSAPATPQYAYAPPMPAFEKGGRVKETYGLENAAEMIRRRGRGEDTVLAHITPQEAGILQLLGGSGQINPYTGLPEFGILKKIVPKPIYKLGSKIGQAIEGGIESIARNKILGPIAQMASYLHPVSAFLYAGLSPEGSSFDVKGAAKAAAMQQIGQAVQQYAMGAPTDGGIGIGSDGASMSDLPYSGGGYGGPGGFGPGAFDADIGLDVMSGGPGTAPPIGAVESAVSSAPFATGPEVVNAGIPSLVERGAEISQIPASGPTNALDMSGFEGGVTERGGSLMNQPPSAPSTPTAPDMSGFEGGVTERGGSYKPGYNATPIETRYVAPSENFSGYRNLDPAGENLLGAAGSVAEGAYDLVAYNPKTAATAAYMGYTAYQTKKELDAARDEANRILADRENRTKEEIEFAQSVLRDYPYNYQRLTEEDIRRERGMAMGGRIDSYDDEIGGDDNMMQGGIASLAKGGLPPRYLRGGGDGMSDSIKANIEGKQEARLADGEFVVPADVVSHLGNGSSNAGAKKLYAMMDRIRKSRTGKTRQAPEVNTRRLMPA
jgi:hypothetical protein